MINYFTDRMALQGRPISLVTFILKQNYRLYYITSDQNTSSSTSMRRPINDKNLAETLTLAEI